ncbi:hypothetical protein BVG16_22690 [Paenibacillus selenitireducens]|uniref:Uncharacterized protein n=1 Tax=Paenibacillus selenitireducens TaxID=1324314 RepID=A0A1T2X400_9BACL|nr:hypothetical protein [Paenibacillus selenitireducens]OPA74577.1 hypothetical protein BVG16_22690 [Paenibacillus selenitireducens]
MTIIRAITPRNVMIFLCAVVLVLIGVKGVYIILKINNVSEADRLWASKQLVEAETFYTKAMNNRWIRYQEDKISARLQELAPITEMKQTLAMLSTELQQVEKSNDFEGLMKAYATYQSFKAPYAKAEHPNAVYYQQIARSTQVAAKLDEVFQYFIARFYAQMSSNLEDKKYDDESFKSNLWKIPAAYFNRDGKRADDLSAKFKKYDEQKMDQIASMGQYQILLNEAMSMQKTYEDLKLKASWVPKKVVSLVDVFLRNDVGQERYADFAMHAKSYVEYAKSMQVKSEIEAYIKSQIRKWMKDANALIRNGEFQKAIQIYEGIGVYQDTKQEMQDAMSAWTAADPVRLLQSVDSRVNYEQVSGGKDRFGAQVYAIATDAMNNLYYGTSDRENHVSVRKYDAVPKGVKIRSLRIEEKLSTSKKPVIIIEMDSNSRGAWYGAFDVSNDQLHPLFQFEADGYEVQSDGTLHVNNPNVAEAEGQMAVYALVNGTYQYTGIVQQFTDIVIEDLWQYQHMKVRFTANIVMVGESGVYAQMGDSFVQLQGDFSYSIGTAVIIGTFDQSKEVQVGDQMLNIPVVEVETITN